MATPVTVTAGVTTIQAEHVNQLVELVLGLRNFPTSLTGINDPTNYALTVKNAGTGSKAQIIYAADGTTVLWQADGNGVKASPDGTTAASAVVTVTGAQDLTGKTYTATKTGATAAARFVGGTATGAPASGTFAVGDFVIDQTGRIWVNTVAGTPGTWVQSAGASPAARAYHNASQTISASTLTALNLNSERFDTDAIHDTVTNTSRLTCKTAGKYEITAMIEWGANATGYRSLSIRLNGTGFLASDERTSIGATAMAQSVTTLWDLAINDYVEITVLQTSGVSLSVNSTASYSPELMMVKVA